jgi:hypothetical protein
VGKRRVNGISWLASRSEFRVAGVLTFSKRRGGKLKLLGSFETVTHLTGQSSVIGPGHQEEVRILGITEKTHLTLEGCLRTSSTADVFGTRERMPTAEYVVSVVLVGIHRSPLCQCG